MRLIDADALITDIKECIEIKDSNFEWEQTKGLKVALSCIDEAQTVQPEIIHCKDCIYYRWEIDMCEYPFSTPHNVVHEYDYCSKAERKTDG